MSDNNACWSSLVNPAGAWRVNTLTGEKSMACFCRWPSLTVPVAGGKPAPCAWQQIFHLECGIKPRRRTIVVTVSGE